MKIEKITNHSLYIELMSYLARIFVVLTFFFPAYYSDFKKDQYFIGFLWPYAVLILFGAMVFLKNYKKKWEAKGFLVLCLLLLVVYAGLSLYVNNVYHHWMWEEIHNVVAFSFVGIMLAYPDMWKNLDFDFQEFLLRCILLSIFCSVVFYFMGYGRFDICNNVIELRPTDSSGNEDRLSWIYYHKSQFGMMMIVFMGFVYRCREKFKSKVRFFLAEGLLVFALYLSHSWTSVLAAFLIPAGILLDYLKEKKVWKNKKFWIGAALAGLAGGSTFFVLFQKMAAERDLLTLGSRIPIWKSGIAYIAEHPWGVGQEFGGNLLKVHDWFYTNNCHNLFLNAAFRFSIPVGIVFTVLFLMVLAYMFRQSKSFFAAGYLLAILVVLNIDYALLSYGVASFFMVAWMTLRKREEPS